MKIAVAGLHTECSTYNPVLAREADFRVLRGPSMLKDQYFDFLTHFPAEFVTIFHARAIAGGPVERALYDRWKGEILDGLKATMPLDGVYLAMHGAMHVDGMFDAEGDWMQSVREVVGPDCIMGASYDLHGNVSAGVIENLDVFSGYRTAPHIDADETRLRTIALLVDCAREGYHPKKAFIPVPIALPGERTSTEWEPGMSLYARIPGVVERDGILDATIMIGYAWADEPRTHAGGKKDGLVTYSPIGVIYSIQPWNFPLYQPVRVLAANLMPESAAPAGRKIGKAGTAPIASARPITSRRCTMACLNPRRGC